MGDPQAPFETVKAVLRHHGLLGADERLRPDVQLVSMGDHFDWGKDRARATSEATAMLRWLAAHPAEQVILLLGNHDLGRVCELAPFTDDASFEAAHALAHEAYQQGQTDVQKQAALLERYPHVPDAECLARDFSCYAAEQQELVTKLLREGRFRLAHAHRGLLLVHAGVTEDDFVALGGTPHTAEAAATALNQFLDERVARWSSGPLNLEPLHRPGSKAHGEATGILFHRPAQPARVAAGPTPRRRYDPRRLPSAFPQAIGHIRDQKCRELLGPWATDAESIDGPLRALQIDGDAVRYARGTPPGARLYFLDGGMLHIAPERYELFDLDDRRALQPTSKLAISGT